LDLLVSQPKTYRLKSQGRILGDYSESELQDLHARQQLTRFHEVLVDGNWTSATGILRSIEEGVLTRQAILDADPGPPPVPEEDTVAYRPFPVWLLIPLHFFTLGVFSFFWITTMHGRLPQTRPDEPTGARALSLMLVPILNMYWMFICYPMLVDRLNRIRERQGLLGNVPMVPALTICFINLAVFLMTVTGSIVLLILVSRGSPYEHAVWFFILMPQVLTAVSYVFVIPMFIATCQSAFNEIAESQRRMLQAHAAAI